MPPSPRMRTDPGDNIVRRGRRWEKPARAGPQPRTGGRLDFDRIVQPKEQPRRPPLTDDETSHPAVVDHPPIEDGPGETRRRASPSAQVASVRRSHSSWESPSRDHPSTAAGGWTGSPIDRSISASEATAARDHLSLPTALDSNVPSSEWQPEYRTHAQIARRDTTAAPPGQSTKFHGCDFEIRQ
jgi:hypothetical protein